MKTKSNLLIPLLLSGTAIAQSPGTMTTHRRPPAATLLPDGRVLIAGLNYDPLGAVILPVAISHADLYDPSAGTFSATGNMTAGRLGHTSTLLPDGTVLVAGGAEWVSSGYGTNGPWSWFGTAELYHPATLIPAPVLYSLSDNGRGQGAIWHADTGKAASSDNPATAEDVLAMYTTALFEGGVIRPQVTIGGQVAEVLFFGDAPGYPSFYRVNFLVPNGAAPGLAVSVLLTYIGRPINEVTIGVQ